MDKNRIKKFEEICKSNKVSIPDTIIINTFIRGNTTFNRSIFWDKEDFQKKAAIWINCKEKNILNQDELNYINDQISRFDNTKKWNDKKLTFNNFKAKFIDLNNNLTSQNCISYNFSEPIMSLDNNYLFFFSEYHIDILDKRYTLKNGYVVMKRVNKKWVFIGDLCESNVLD